MSRRDLTIKWTFFSFAALFFIAVQQLLLNHWELWGVHPFILPMLPVMAVILEGQKEGTFFAVGVGLFCDLLWSAVIPCFYTLAFLLCALLAGLLAGRVIMSGVLCAFVCGTLALVVTDLLMIVILINKTSFALTDALLLSGKELLLSVAAAPLIFLVYRKISRRMHNS